MKIHRAIVLLNAVFLLAPAPAGGDRSVTPEQRAEHERAAGREIERRVLEWVRNRSEGTVEWSTPIEISGQGLPRLTLRHGRVRVVEGKVRFSEGLEATIESVGGSQVQYSFVDGRWRLRGFAAVVGATCATGVDGRRC